MPLFPKADRRLAAWVDRFGHLPRGVLAFCCAVAVGIIGWADIANGPRVSLAVFYLVPFTFATYYLGRIWGLLTATICGCLWSYDSAGLLPNAGIPIIAWACAVKTTFFVLIMWLVAGLREAVERARAQANTDEMTGVCNRRAFLAAAESELVRARRSANPISIIYMDCDHLKTLNDQLGHTAGDQALRTVAQTLKSTTRQTDVVARIGGDEFVVLLPNSDATAAKNVVDKLRAGVAEAMAAGRWPITLSMGVVTFGLPPASADELIRQADALQYVVKHGQKNGVLFQTIGGLTKAA
ncbi:MAG: GGDEF domain-containing protein [Phycisphaerales bacterium]